MASRARLSRWVIVAAALTALALGTCSRPVEQKVIPPVQPKAQATPEQLEQKETEKKEPTVVPPEVRSAIVVFLSGDVTVNEGSGWQPAEIGAQVPRSSTLKVGEESHCQLQFGKAAVVSIEQNTMVALDTISLETDRSKVVLGLDAGTIVCKVSALSAGSKFKVMTQTAICGVRGTEFIVRVSEKQETVLAVKKGVVAVLPATRVMQSVRDRLKDETDPIAPALDKIEETAPVVKEAQQVVVTREEAVKAEEAYKEVEAKLSLLLEKREKGAAVTWTEVQELEKTVDKAVPEIEKLVEKPKRISANNLKSLERTDNMRFMNLPAVPETQPETGEPSTVPEPEKSQPISVRIKTAPADAAISLNGLLVGKGECVGAFSPGDALTIQVRRDGYEAKSLRITVTKDAPTTYEIRLKPKKAEIRVRATPADAEIFLGGKPVGKGSYTASFPIGSKLTFAARKKGFGERDLDVTVASSARKSYYIELEQSRGQIILKAIPVEAEILLDGAFTGTGSFTGLFPLGEKHTVLVRADGYVEKSLELLVEPGSDWVYQVELEAKPVERRFSVSTKPIIGRPIVRGGKIYVADSAGVLSAATLRGELLWTLATNNTPNETSSPQIIGNMLCFSGSSELVIADADTGKETSRHGLDSVSAHLFGQHVVEVEQNIAFPANDTIRILSPEDGSLIKSIHVPEGSKMTPTVWQGDFLIVSQAGTFLRLDPDTDTIFFQIPTKAVQPVALSVQVYVGKAYFADRKGLVVCVDLEKREVVWKKPLVTSGSAGVFQDLECGKEGVFAFAKGSIYGLANAQGAPLFSPLSGAACPPLLHNGLLYYGNVKGELIVADAATGKTLKTLNANARIVSRPEWVNGKIVACTANGEILVLKPEAIQ